MTSACMAIATGRTLDHDTIATIASQTKYSRFSLLDLREDQLPWQPLYLVCNVVQVNGTCKHTAQNRGGYVEGAAIVAGVFFNKLW